MDPNSQILEIKNFYKTQLSIHKKNNGDNIYFIRFNNFCLIVDYLGIYIPPIIVINPILKFNFINSDGKIQLDKIISWNYKTNLLETIRKIENYISTIIINQNKNEYNYHRSFSTQINNNQFDKTLIDESKFNQSQIIANRNSLHINSYKNDNLNIDNNIFNNSSLPSKEELKKLLLSKYNIDELILIYHNKNKLMKFFVNNEKEVNDKLYKDIKDTIEKSKNKLFEILNYQVQFDMIINKIPSEEQLKHLKQEKIDVYSLITENNNNNKIENNGIEGKIINLIENKYSKERTLLSSSILNNKISVSNKEEFKTFINDYTKSVKNYYTLNFILDRIRNCHNMNNN